MRTFRRKHDVIMAIQYTGDNKEEVISYIDDRLFYNKSFQALQNKEYKSDKIYEGSWVWIDEEGDIDYRSEEEFQDEYIEVKE